MSYSIYVQNKTENNMDKFPYSGKAVAELKSNKYIKILLSHIVKMLNVFHHVFTSQRPLFIPKGQKSDLFIGSKELNVLNSFGYFGNDYFYLRLYKSLKVSYDTYKVSFEKSPARNRPLCRN